MKPHSFRYLARTAGVYSTSPVRSLALDAFGSIGSCMGLCKLFQFSKAIMRNDRACIIIIIGTHDKDEKHLACLDVTLLRSQIFHCSVIYKDGISNPVGVSVYKPHSLNSQNLST